MQNISLPQTQVVPSQSASNLQAWVAIAVLILGTSLCLAVKAGVALRFGFPSMSFLIGVFLYRTQPSYYVGFSWWIWILTPLISRLSDHLTSWDPQRAIMIAPFLVSGISVATLFRHVMNSNEKVNLPFRLILVGLLYATLIGYVVSSPISMIRSLMEWLVPVSFGYHLFCNWRLYPQYANTLRTTFLWGVLVTGCYGVFQFMTAPEWDCKWLIETGLVSLGKPEPFGIRVWSTMNAAAPFASFMMSGLLLLLSSNSPLQIPATVVGYLSLLLSLARTAWGGWLIGLILMTASIKLELQVRIVLLLLVVGLCVIPLTSMEPFSEVIGTRLESMKDIENDSSFNARSGDLGGYLYGAISNPLGQGFGGVWVRQPNGALLQQVTDNGLVDMFGTLGWLGTAPYLMGLLMLTALVFKAKAVRHDTFMSAARGISISFVIQMASTNSLIGLGGMFMWGFLGIVLSGERYHRHQQSLINQYDLDQLLLEEI
jgi:hypothetical protein